MAHTEIFKTWQDFLNREDKRLNGVSPEFAEIHPDFAEQNKTNIACWNCYGCSKCRACSTCYSSHGLSGCSNYYEFSHGASHDT